MKVHIARKEEYSLELIIFLDPLSHNLEIETGK